MIEEAGEKIHEQLRLVWKKFLAAFPVICFFLFLFFGVLNIFGSQYVMIVSLVTVLFQVNYKKRNSLKSLLAAFSDPAGLCSYFKLSSCNDSEPDGSLCSYFFEILTV